MRIILGCVASVLILAATACSSGGGTSATPGPIGTIAPGSISFNPSTVTVSASGTAPVTVSDSDSAYTGQYGAVAEQSTIPSSCIAFVSNPATPNAVTIRTGTAISATTTPCPVGASGTYEFIDSLGHNTNGQTLTVTITP